ncbi:helix-turn-helix domain-containing protein [Wenyingzhuangia sp. IMCC45533]
MFREILNNYLKTKGISQSELASLTGDSQQAISDFLNKKGNPQKKTREKFFNSLHGFKEYYDLYISKSSNVNEPDSKYHSPVSLHHFSVDEIMTYLFKNKDNKSFKNNTTYKMFVDIIIKQAKIDGDL